MKESFQRKEFEEALNTNQSHIVVRYAETDQMGIVHHSNYPIWFEIGRTDFITNAGYSYSALEARGVLLPLINMSCVFKSPARYEDKIIIKTSISSLAHVKIGFRYEVIHEDDGRLIAIGETKHGWTNKTMKPIIIEKEYPKLYKDIEEIYKSGV